MFILVKLVQLDILVNMILEFLVVQLLALMVVVEVVAAVDAAYLQLVHLDLLVLMEPQETTAHLVNLVMLEEMDKLLLHKLNMHHASTVPLDLPADLVMLDVRVLLVKLVLLVVLQMVVVVDLLDQPDLVVLPALQAIPVKLEHLDLLDKFVTFPAQLADPAHLDLTVLPDNLDLRVVLANLDILVQWVNLAMLDKPVHPVPPEAEETMEPMEKAVLAANAITVPHHVLLQDIKSEASRLYFSMESTFPLSNFLFTCS